MVVSKFKPLALQHILFCIIDSGCKSRDVLQSYFDLLGELMKFNIDAFKRFNKYVNTEEKVSVSCRSGNVLNIGSRSNYVTFLKAASLCVFVAAFHWIIFVN